MIRKAEAKDLDRIMEIIKATKHMEIHNGMKIILRNKTLQEI